MRIETDLWSWVNKPESARPPAKGPGRYVRPLAVRDRVIVSAFGTEIRRLRLERGLSTYQLAERLSMRGPAVQRIESKRMVNIDLRLVWDFADALGVRPLHLIDVCIRAIEEEWIHSGRRRERMSPAPSPRSTNAKELNRA